jgi:hypothetical protein
VAKNNPTSILNSYRKSIGLMLYSKGNIVGLTTRSSLQIEYNFQFYEVLRGWCGSECSVSAHNISSASVVRADLSHFLDVEYGL